MLEESKIELAKHRLATAKEDYIASKEEAEEQISNAIEFYDVVYKYIKGKSESGF